MHSLIKVAGVNICKISVHELHLSYLHVLPRLRVLCVVSATSSLDLSPLIAMQQLEELCIGVKLDEDNDIEDESEVIDLAGLHLPCLRVLRVVDGLAIHMPPSITELELMYVVDREKGESAKAYSPSDSELEVFRAWFSTFEGVLTKAELDMQLFAQDPAQLHHPRSGAPCLLGVTELSLTFAVADAYFPSKWCQGFTQLRTLALHFCEPYLFSDRFCPTWDLSSTNLAKLSIILDPNVSHALGSHGCTPEAQGLCLSKVTRVTADTCELKFLGEGMGTTSPLLSCKDWAVSHVNICYDTLFNRAGLPECVIAALGAFLGSQACDYANIRVNGMAPAAAIAAAIA